MKKGFCRLAALAGALCLAACSLGPGKPVSDLITHPLQKNKAHSAFDGIWLADRREVAEQKKMYVYVAPVQTKLPKKSSAVGSYMAGEFGDSLKKEVRALLARQPKGRRWEWSETPRTPGVTLSLAIVKLKPASVTGKVAAVGAIPLPVPGVSFLLNEFSKGSVGIEGRLAETGTQKSLAEFAACNSDPINIFSCNQFEQYACDKYNLDRFAADIAALLPRVGAGQAGAK